MRRISRLLLGLGASLGVLMAPSVQADEAVLTAISAFQEGSMIDRPFARFVEKVNEEGKGIVQIKVIGGPSTMPPFELGSAVSSGVVDMAFNTTAFYTNLVPEADALKLSDYSMDELRENGGWEYLNELHNQKMNSWFLAMTGDGVPYHLYVNKPVEKADLSGLTLRVTPVYRAFFEKLGASNVQTPPSEVYTALERGVVDGYGWPMQGVLDLGWQEVTKARVDPGFYNVNVNVLINLDKWNALSDEQRDFLTEMGEWLESTNKDNEEINADEAKKQADAGLVVYTLEGEERDKWLAQAKEAGWEQILEVAPETGARLKEFLSK